jgi:hypothetical protein
MSDLPRDPAAKGVTAFAIFAAACLTHLQLPWSLWKILAVHGSDGEPPVAGFGHEVST